MNSVRERSIETALAIGRLLVRDALWDDVACNWLTQTRQSVSLGTQWVVHACDPGLESGAVGIALFLSRLSGETDDPMFAEVIAGVAHLVTQSDAPPSTPAAAALMEMTHDPSMSDSRQSISEHLGAAIVETANEPPRLMSDANTRGAVTDVDSAEAAIDRWRSDAEQFPCFVEPLIADGLLCRANVRHDAQAIDATDCLAQYIVDMVERYGQPWREFDSREYPPLGLAGGLAGIGHFLLAYASKREIPTLTIEHP